MVVSESRADNIMIIITIQLVVRNRINKVVSTINSTSIIFSGKSWSINSLYMVNDGVIIIFIY